MERVSGWRICQAAREAAVISDSGGARPRPPTPSPPVARAVPGTRPGTGWVDPAGSPLGLGFRSGRSRRPPRVWGRRARMHGFALAPENRKSTRRDPGAAPCVWRPGWPLETRRSPLPGKPRIGGPACADPSDDEFLGEDAQRCRSQSRDCGPRNLLLAYHSHLHSGFSLHPFSCVV